MVYKKVVFFLALLVTSAPSSAHPLKKVHLDENLFKEVDGFVEKMMALENIQGLSYAVLYKGETVHKNGLGYASLEWKIAAKPETVYAIASITKLLSTTAIHQLLKSKKHNVDEPIGNFLKDLPESWRSLSIKQLLSHSSGLPRYLPELGVNPKNREAVFEATKDKPFEFKPGESNRYNQTAYLLLLMLVETLSGMSLEEYLQVHFFDPLEMNNTQYGNVSAVIPSRATHYLVFDHSVQRDLRMNYTPPIHAAAGLNSSVDDLSIWFQNLLSGKFLDKEDLKTIWQPVKLNDGRNGGFGLGWFAMQGNDFSSAGHGGGDFADLRHYWHHDTKESVTVILLTNGASERAVLNLTVAIADHFLPGLLNPSVTLYYDFKSAVNKRDLKLIKQLYQSFRAKYSKPMPVPYSIYGKEVISSEDPVNMLGFWLLSKKIPKEALYYFKQNVKDYPESINAWDSLANGYEQNGHFKKAMQALNVARDLLSGENDPYYSMVMGHIEQLNDKVK